MQKKNLDIQISVLLYSALCLNLFLHCTEKKHCHKQTLREKGTRNMTNRSKFNISPDERNFSETTAAKKILTPQKNNTVLYKKKLSKKYTVKKTLGFNLY